MTDNCGQQEISLASGFEAVVHYGGATVMLHPGGGVDVYAAGDVDAYTNGAVHVHPAEPQPWEMRNNGATIGKGVITEIIGSGEDVPRRGSAAPIASSPQIGDVMPPKDAHAGYSYAGEDRNGKLWVAFAPKSMNHYDAAGWAKEQGGSLPTKKEGKYLDSVKGQLSTLFNRSGSFPAGYVWLAEPFTKFSDYAWCQRLGDGDQYDCDNRNYELPVLCVRR